MYARIEHQATLTSMCHSQSHAEYWPVRQAHLPWHALKKHLQREREITVPETLYHTHGLLIVMKYCHYSICALQITNLFAIACAGEASILFEKKHLHASAGCCPTRARAAPRAKALVRIKALYAPSPSLQETVQQETSIPNRNATNPCAR